MKNYYAILQVPVGGSLEEIRQAYRRLASENLDDAAAFAELKEAHDVLTNPAKRAEYDLAAWGEIFTPGGDAAGLPLPVDVLKQFGRCPMGAEENCPVLQGRVSSADHFCPECGYGLNTRADGRPDLGPQAESPAIRLEEVGGRIHPLAAGNSLVGREMAEVLLPDKTVSRQHARLEVTEDGEITLEDLSSTNGTQVNDLPLVPHLPRRLAAGDRVRFGSVLTTLHVPEAQETVTENGSENGLTDAEEILDIPSPAARARLRETREAGPDEEAPRVFDLLPGVTTFGRRIENSVVLPGDPYVSGSHAQIIAEGDLFRLIDVGSTNGTLLNGERLTINEPVLLSAGDLIVIGGTALGFEPISAEESKEETREKAADEPQSPEDALAAPSQTVQVEG